MRSEELMYAFLQKAFIKMTKAFHRNAYGYSSFLVPNSSLTLPEVKQ